MSKVDWTIYKKKKGKKMKVPEKVKLKLIYKPKREKKKTATSAKRVAKINIEKAVGVHETKYRKPRIKRPRADKKNPGSVNSIATYVLSHSKKRFT